MIDTLKTWGNDALAWIKANPTTATIIGAGIIVFIIGAWFGHKV